MPTVNKAEIVGRIHPTIFGRRYIGYNAGLAGQTLAIERLETFGWDEVVNSNLKSVFLCTKAVLPWMKKTNGGPIINLPRFPCF